MAAPIYNVLFLCTANSARSIMAEAILNRDGKGRFHAYSAGSNPSGRVSSHALTLLKILDYDIDQLRSKSWDEFGQAGAPEMDFVFTVCDDAAGETCPVWPGHPATAHWGIPDPAKVTGNTAEIAEAYDDAYRMLSTRIGLFINLPLEKLDRVSLHQHLAKIGATEQPDSKTPSAA